MMNGSEIREIIPLLIPLVVIQLGLIAIALRDLKNRKRVAGRNKLVWVLVIVLIHYIGPILYLTIGRKDD
ncbi:PLD nuclease N-terminal domain-containing protein [Candidatus Acetothermia bacterium]|nr:PLD nuclease N-terminal domain-containing protein [Candidatus Acetothermia bacterium]MCI2427056.1 PLD nuclease N-terminal domain-containing protein [Candidatus Acetothermia bacterium]